MIKEVRLCARVEKELKKLPLQVRRRLLGWALDVQRIGLEEVRKCSPGLHDEPLAGNRAGQRSIRLNLHWRAIYEIRGDAVAVALVVEVTPHKY
ncbi:MAG: type toxin-antitoxin system mRNA interferase toxin, RelE/StbE family [Myxococcaceae bacterium]|nr:type toxin-antitoxin system mRNA interferase toxin, RelE/StbE family [Myxococcaceae bacterium]